MTESHISRDLKRNVFTGDERQDRIVRRAFLVGAYSALQDMIDQGGDVVLEPAAKIAVEVEGYLKEMEEETYGNTTQRAEA